MLCFRSEAAVDAWCARRRIARGAVLTLEQTWKLSRAWYTGRELPEWRGRTPEQAETIFRSLGFEGSFWNMSVASPPDVPDRGLDE